MSIALREGVQRLEVTLRITLAVLALGSGVYTLDPRYGNAEGKAVFF